MKWVTEYTITEHEVNAPFGQPLPPKAYDVTINPNVVSYWNFVQMTWKNEKVAILWSIQYYVNDVSVFEEPHKP